MVITSLTKLAYKHEPDSNADPPVKALQLTGTYEAQNPFLGQLRTPH